MIIFSGSSNPVLAQKIAEKAQATLGEVMIETFKNGEKRIKILSDVTGKEVAVVQSFSQPVDTHIIEFLLMTDALERAGAQRVVAVIPWMGYSLQDKVFVQGEPIAARVVADLISHAYTKRVILLDLHNSSITGFFSVPTQHLRAINLFEQYAKDHFNMNDVVVISPDFGGIKQARVFADLLHVNLSNIDKHRDLNSGEVTTVGIAGDSVEGKICLVYDDVVNTGSTVIKVARFLKEKGAREVHFMISHGIFAGDSMKSMNDSVIDSIIITDSILHSQPEEKIKILNLDQLFAHELAN